MNAGCLCGRSRCRAICNRDVSDDREHARSIIALVAFGWETKEQSTVKHFSPEEAMAHVCVAEASDILVFGDFSDNPGGGSYGDARCC